MLADEIASVVYAFLSASALARLSPKVRIVDAFRGWWRNAIFVFWWVLTSVAMIALAGGAALPAYLLALVAIVGVFRSLRCAVVVKPDGLTIRKVWSTHHVAREQVAGLDCYYNWLAGTENCLAVRLTSGGLVKTLSVPVAQSLFGERSKPTVGLMELETRMNAFLRTDL